MRHLYFLLAILLCPSLLMAADAPVVKAPADFPAYTIDLDDVQMNGINRLILPPMNSPRRDSIIGDLFQAGDTYFDYQSNGTVGKMIAVDTDGGVHVTWMDGEDSNNNTRHQRYNFFDPEEEEWIAEDGEVVDGGSRSGYGSLWLTAEEEQRALVFYHVDGAIGIDEVTGACGIDFLPQLGAFQSSFLPVYPEQTVIWSQGVCSPEGLLHVVYNRRDARMISYTYGTYEARDQPIFDEDFPFEVGETHLNTYRIARSPISERVAITWMTSRVGVPAPVEWAESGAYQMNNELMMAVSENGEDWDFDNPTNVSNVIPTDPQQRDSLLAFGDTLRPFVTHDVIFDSDDLIHIVFEARGFWEMANYDPQEDQPPVYGVTVDASFLFHWFEGDSSITPVADGWFSQEILDENDERVIWPTPGAWKSNVCNPSLGYDEHGDLYCVFNYYPTEDYNDYVGNGRCHGDIAVTVSEDNGETWYQPTMVAQTSSPLADPGEAMCEVYPTQWEVVDDFLHIFYMIDKEAGTPIQAADVNARNTLNPFYYHRVSVDDIERDDIWEDGPDFHVRDPESVSGDDRMIPRDFALTSVYPNPFNSRTSVLFTTRGRQMITLSVFTLDGRKVAELFSGVTAPGNHKFTWDAKNLPAGIYLVDLSSNVARSTMKVVLIN